ncbi:hypothetical protein AB4Y69_03620 [Bacillus sp. YAF8]|uniref:hypothetical protein n=1 Tax=Bacillus TaxID=1386 RepID=UPI00345A7504
MNLRVKIDDSDIVELTKIQFNTEKSEFVLRGFSKNFNKFKAEINYPLEPKTQYKKDEYEIYLFFNDNFAENDIYQVYEHQHGVRVGWVFPMQSLLSNKHNYAENEHFLPYAYVAFEKLLNIHQPQFINIPLFNDQDKYSLDDFYNTDESIVMILSKKNLEGIEGFDICNYLPYLYSKGFYYTTGNYRNPISINDKRLNLKSVSDSVKNDGFIIQLFKELLLYEKHHLVKFYLLYQVIELLIEKVFNKELTNMLNDLSTQKKSLFQVKEDLSNIAREKERIIKLFSKYTNTMNSKTMLMNFCNSLLEIVNRGIKNNVAEALYSVRNLFVHEYRSIPEAQHTLIDKINETFEELIIEMLCEVKDIT